jgi:hypothetical protein
VNALEFTPLDRELFSRLAEKQADQHKNYLAEGIFSVSTQAELFERIVAEIHTVMAASQGRLSPSLPARKGPWSRLKYRILGPGRTGLLPAQDESSLSLSSEYLQPLAARLARASLGLEEKWAAALALHLDNQLRIHFFRFRQRLGASTPARNSGRPGKES